MNDRRVWRAAPRTLALVWVFIGVAIAALPLLAVTVWVRGGDRLVAVVLLALTAAAVAYGWRFGLHPRLAVVDDRLVIRNPWRTIRLPLADIIAIEPGENGIRVSTAERVHEVWCVQKSTAAIRTGRTDRADRIVAELRASLPAEDDPELLIHRATPGDETTLATLERQASEAALRHVFPPAFAYPIDEVTGRWRQHLGDRTVRARVAELDGEPVGYLAYRDDQILHLGVLPAHQGHGYGRALVDYAAADILHRHEQVSLWVLRDNVGARGFYRRYGFVDTDQERPCEFPPQPVEVRMLLIRPR